MPDEGHMGGMMDDMHNDETGSPLNLCGFFRSHGKQFSPEIVEWVVYICYQAYKDFGLKTIHLNK